MNLQTERLPESEQYADEGEPLPHDQGTQEEWDPDWENYKEFLIQLRGGSLRLKKQCSTPIGELTSLLVIQKMSREGEEVNASSLGKRLNLSRPAISRMLHALRKKGYIEFFSGKKDHRYIFIALTEKGAENIRKEMQCCMALLQEVTLKMGKEDMEQFLHFFKKFFSILADGEGLLHC